MNSLLALSLSSSVTDVGAIAAFVALLGIAILSLLVFSQAREIKRLREWAGRAPERAAEVEQRVSTDAAARVQRAGAPVAQARVPSGARVAPRKTPLVSAPVSSAVSAAATGAMKTVPPPGSQPAPAPATTTAHTPPAPVSVPEAPLHSGGEAVVASGAPDAAESEPTSQTASESADGVESSEPSPALTPRPVTAAAVAARAPLPPSPADPAPPGAASPPSAHPSSLPLSASDLQSSPASAAAAEARAPKPASRPPAPVAAARRVPSRAVGVSPADAPPRSSVPSRVRSSGAGPSAGATAAGRAASARGPGEPSGAGGPKYFTPERSSGRAFALIAGGVIVGVLVLVLAVSVLKGGGGGAATATTRSSVPSAETQPASTHTTSTTAHVPASNPAETAVAVVNGTGTAGLAHHLAADLQQSGYTRAAALAGIPPGTHASTVVQYTHGHRADAQAVARVLNVTQVQPIETTVAPLAGSATVLVLAGADQASQLGGGGAQSNGEPGAGTGGEGASGSG
jgi:hypothetical protein